MANPLKILFISAQDTKGGASLAAFRLSKGLEHYHHTENMFIVGKKHSADEHVFCTRASEGQALIEALLDKIMNKLGLQYFCFPFSNRFILKQAREFKPDIISLHNIHEGYFKTTLLKKLSAIAPIVWTLHDMWAFTGTAVATYGDESWKQMRSGPGEYRAYPPTGWDNGRWLLKRKKRIYQKCRLHFIAPSTWMRETAAQSPVFAGKSIDMIHHGLDLDLFSPGDKDVCRKVLDIPPDAPTIMFSCDGDIDLSPWKGGQMLVDILTSLNSKTKKPIHVLVVGKGRLKAADSLQNLILHRTGYVSSQTFIPVLLSAADLFIYPTRADSFGLVLAEAIACGTPAITFEIGGCPDIIKNDVSGKLVKPFDIEDFSLRTLELLEHPDELAALSRSARKFSEQHFDIKDMAFNYFQLFSNILPGGIH